MINTPYRDEFTAVDHQRSRNRDHFAHGRPCQRAGPVIRRVDVTSLAFGPTWRCSSWAAARWRTAATTSWCGHRTTRPSGGATSCCSTGCRSPASTSSGSTGSRATFPDARHLAFGVDGTVGRASDLAGFADMGLSIDASTVMTATSVHRPPRPNDEAEYRRLTSDDDWAQVLRVRILANATDDDPGFETFESRRVADRPGHQRGRRGRVVRRVPRRPARLADGARQGRPRTGPVPAGRDRPGVPGTGTGRERWCTTSASTASASSAPPRW